jgi:hypothetical protein
VSELLIEPVEEVSEAHGVFVVDGVVLELMNTAPVKFMMFITYQRAATFWGFPYNVAVL